jgi:hypothetical protein
MQKRFRKYTPGTPQKSFIARDLDRKLPSWIPRVRVSITDGWGLVGIGLVVFAGLVALGIVTF